MLTDVTYVPFDGRFCYLSTIIDAFTKQILSYVLSESLEVDFVLETVNLMIEKHGVSLTTKTILHNVIKGAIIRVAVLYNLSKIKAQDSLCPEEEIVGTMHLRESFFGRMKGSYRRQAKKNVEHIARFVLLLTIGWIIITMIDISGN